MCILSIPRFQEFLQFSRLSRITGVAIAKQICSDLTDLGLDLKNIRGQGYDRASNMSSARVGVQAIIRRESPLAVYTHCSSHCLNLVTVETAFAGTQRDWP